MHLNLKHEIMNSGERFKLMLDDLKLSKNAFAGTLGVSSTVINGIVSNLHAPGLKVLKAIQNTYPQYNTDWLSTGKGEMKNAKIEGQISSRDYLQEYLVRLENQFKSLIDQLEVKDKQIETKDRQIERLMDLLGKLSLGEDITCPVYELNYRSAA